MGKYLERKKKNTGGFTEVFDILKIHTISTIAPRFSLLFYASFPLPTELEISAQIKV